MKAGNRFSMWWSNKINQRQGCDDDESWQICFAGTTFSFHIEQVYLNVGEGGNVNKTLAEKVILVTIR